MIERVANGDEADANSRLQTLAATKKLGRIDPKLIGHPGEEEERSFSPFWYSVSLFLPMVDLCSSTVWRPKYDPADRTTHWRVRYVPIHILAGWVFIPVGLASLTGIIK